MRTQIVKSNQCDLLENGGSQWELLIIEMNGPRYLGFSWISVSYTVTLSKIQQKGFGKRPDDALKTCSWNLQKLSRVERSCLPTLFWPIYFLTNGSFGLSRTRIFILGCAIALSKKSRLIRGSPKIEYRLNSSLVFNITVRLCILWGLYCNTLQRCI